MKDSVTFAKHVVKEIGLKSSQLFFKEGLFSE